MEDEDEQVNFDNMEPYEEDLLINALEAKKPVVFFAHDLQTIAKRLSEELLLTFTPSSNAAL